MLSKVRVKCLKWNANCQAFFIYLLMRLPVLIPGGIYVDSRIHEILSRWIYVATSHETLRCTWYSSCPQHWQLARGLFPIRWTINEEIDTKRLYIFVRVMFLVIQILLVIEKAINVFPDKCFTYGSSCSPGWGRRRQTCFRSTGRGCTVAQRFPPGRTCRCPRSETPVNARN